LPPEPHEKIVSAEDENDPVNQARVVADYIAGMTDRYAIKEYERIFNPMQLT
jgi:dGTPase